MVPTASPIFALHTCGYTPCSERIPAILLLLSCYSLDHNSFSQTSLPLIFHLQSPAQAAPAVPRRAPSELTAWPWASDVLPGGRSRAPCSFGPARRQTQAADPFGARRPCRGCLAARPPPPAVLGTSSLRAAGCSRCALNPGDRNGAPAVGTHPIWWAQLPAGPEQPAVDFPRVSAVPRSLAALLIPTARGA